MPVLVLPLLFLITGGLSVWYYRHVPEIGELRSRLPNRVSWAALLFIAIIAAGAWYIVTRLSTPFLKASGITTLMFFLLVFETAFLLMLKWIRSNTAAVVLASSAAAVPFAVQIAMPSYTLINLIIILATLGATTLIVRMQLLRTRIIVLATALLTVNDAVNVWYVLPNLPLGPVPSTPLPLLILPAVTIAGRVVGSGDFMFLVLATVVLLRDFTWRTAAVHVLIQAAALAITIFVTEDRDVLIPYLLVMAPIFIATYIVAKRHTTKPAVPTVPRA